MTVRAGRRFWALTLLPLSLVALSSPTSTTAAWVDSEHATAVLTAGQIDPPTNVACEDDPPESTARMTWAAPATGVAPSGYTVVLSRRGSPVPDDTRTFVVPPGRTHFDISSGLTPVGDYTVTIYSTRAAWLSEPSTVWVVGVNVDAAGTGFASCEGALG